MPYRPQRTRKHRRRPRYRLRQSPPPSPRPPQTVAPSTSTTHNFLPGIFIDYEDAEYIYSMFILSLAEDKNEDNMFSRAYVKPSPSLSHCLFNDDCDDDDFDSLLSAPDVFDIRCSVTATSDSLALNTSTSFEGSTHKYLKTLPKSEESDEASGGIGEVSQEIDDQKIEEEQPKYVRTVLVKNDTLFMRPGLDNKIVRPVLPCVLRTESEETACMRDLERRTVEGEYLTIRDILLHRTLKKRERRRKRNSPYFNPLLSYHSYLSYDAEDDSDNKQEDSHNERDDPEPIPSTSGTSMT